MARPIFLAAAAIMAIVSVYAAEGQACKGRRPAEAYRANIAAGMKTPETSRLFEKFTDPVSGVVSYILKPGSIAFNQQTTYFTAKSMTDDGRFLVFHAADDEFPPEKKGKQVAVKRRKVLIDFLKDEAIDIGAGGGIPFLDTATDQMWYTDNQGLHRRDFLVNPTNDVLVCTWPPELAPKRTGGRYGTHITFSPDRRLMFMDTTIDGQDVEGVVDTATGKWIEWARSNFLCNHGQFNPKDPTLAMCAWENAWQKVRDEMTPEEIAKATFTRRFVSDIRRDSDDVYPRLWLMRQGKKWEVTSKITGYATHEYFAEDGKGFYWCSSGVSYHDLATGREWRINPVGSAHATMTADNRYIVADCSWGGWWRGCGWTVHFWNRDTHRAVYVHSCRPRIASKANESKLHPDPHPHFACLDRYIISTFNDEERRMNVSITPVEQLVRITSDPATAPKPKTFPLAFDPASRTDATYEMEIDVKSLKDRKFVASPPCTVGADSYTPFALRAVVGGKEGPLPFEAVQGSDFKRNVVLRFKLPKGVEKLFCVADAPGRFEYYDSESCANIFAHAYEHENLGRWTCGTGVEGSTHRAGLVFTRTAADGDAFPGAAYTADLPDGVAGRDFKFELNLNNLGVSEWCGGIRMQQLDASGAELGDAFNGRGLTKTIAPGRRREFRLTGRIAPAARKVRLEIGLKSKDGKPAKVLVWRMNLREATVFPYTPPADVTMKTPETSKNFVKRVDKRTKLTSYVLKPGLVDDSQQSWYFTAKSMTDDGRFLFFWAFKNENKPQTGKRMAYVDFLDDTVHTTDIMELPFQKPFLDVETDRLYYIRRNPDRICRRDMLSDPEKEITMAMIPERFTRPGVKVRYYCTHLTLTRDRQKAFLDVGLTEDGKDTYEQGLLDLTTGRWEKWTETDFFCNHGQICPTDDALALCAWERCWKKTVVSNGVPVEIDRPKDEPYPRVWLLRADGTKRNILPEEFNYATHEHWQTDGKGIMWCCSNGLYGYNLGEDRQYCIMPFAAGHATMTDGNRYVVTDYPVGGWYRGCNWQTVFYDRMTGKVVFPHYKNDRLCPDDGGMHNHPDPHPQFVCRDRYIVSTINMADGHMDLSVTPVGPLMDRTRFATDSGGHSRNFWFDALPKEASPMEVGGRIVRQFLSSPPDAYFPKGATALHARGYVPYAIVSTWANAIEYASRTHNAYLETRLADLFKPFTGPKKNECSRPDHVDFSIFGAVPMSVARLTGDKTLRKFGLDYADRQWTRPAGPEDVRISKNEVDVPYEERLRLFDQGYTAQTRFWIDDMYMITVLQTQAYLTTRDRKYLDRAAKEMCLYLDRLQLKEGRAKGLFYHAPDVPYVWGRGAGWMAGGMALLLRHLPEDSEYHARIMAGYRSMMEALLRFQRADGMWGQLVDEPESWAESSGSAMFTSAFIVGVRRGWLDMNAYGPAARKAWLALCRRLDRYGNISDVCMGTGKKNDHQYYLDRPRLNGDPHGQAPMLWCVNAMLE